MTTGWFEGDTTYQPVTGWWVERHESFALVVEPVIGLSAGHRAAASLVVTPELDMVAAGTSKAAVGLAVTPSLSMGAPHPTSIGLELTPELGMTGGERYPAEIDLTVTPALAMTGEQVFKQTISLDLEPQLGMDGAGTSKTGFGLELAPELGVTAAGTSAATFGLTVTPELAVSGSELYTRNLPLAVTPGVGMSVGERYNRGITLSVTPSVGMTGEGIEPPPAVLFDAVGAGNSLTSSGSFSMSWSHTASGDGRAVVVSLATQILAGNITGITATYGGQAMTALTSRGFNNGAAGLTQQFILLNPPTGAQTVQVNITLGGAFPIASASANSTSYNHVASYAQGASSHGSSASRSLTVTTADQGDMVVQAFGSTASSIAMTGYSQTQRAVIASGSHASILIGDSDEGDNNIVFTATGPNVAWSGVSVILHPA